MAIYRPLQQTDPPNNQRDLPNRLELTQVVVRLHSLEELYQEPWVGYRRPHHLTTPLLQYEGAVEGRVVDDGSNVLDLV